jgi:hypothetical protein
MDAEKVVSLSRQWIADCREALLAPRVRENALLYAENVREIYEQGLFIGLVFWRNGQSPVPALTAAVKELDEHATYLGQASADAELPWASAGLVRTLLGLPRRLRASRNASAPDVELDVQLLNAIQSMGNEAAINVQLRQLGGDGAGPLAARSYEAYFRLLTEGASPELLKLAEANYKARARDRFYLGGVTQRAGDQTTQWWLITDLGPSSRD